VRHIVTVVVFIAFVAACKAKTTRYELTGEVVQRNPATSEITVKHDEIPGFMPAMTMPYKVASPLMAAVVEPGDKIAADVITQNSGKDYWLDNIRITDTSGRKAPKAPPAVHALPTGSRAPDLELVNQDGKMIRLADFKGKALLVTFIYTRCPLPNFCPRLSSEFARIQEDLAKTPDDYSRTHLLAITLDPKYDTPEVLRKYGLAYLHGDASGFSHWDFAATSADTLEKLAGAFGLSYEEADNQISHTMNIVLIAPDGTISKYWTTDWTRDELEDALRQAAQKSSPR
jgi:protein SCO1